MKLHKEFFHCVIPSMLAFALSGVYAIADGFFVGNALGDSALAAVNLAYPLTAFLQAVGTGIGMGGAIQYAISAGTENHKRCRWYQRGAFDKHMDDYVYRSCINNYLNLELHIQ